MFHIIYIEHGTGVRVYLILGIFRILSFLNKLYTLFTLYKSVLITKILPYDENTTQPARTARSTSGRHRYDVSSSCRCRPDVGPLFCAGWARLIEVYGNKYFSHSSTINLCCGNSSESPLCNNINCKKSRRIYGKITGNWLPAHLPLILTSARRLFTGVISLGRA